MRPRNDLFSATSVCSMAAKATFAGGGPWAKTFAQLRRRMTITTLSTFTHHLVLLFLSTTYKKHLSLFFQTSVHLFNVAGHFFKYLSDNDLLVFVYIKEKLIRKLFKDPEFRFYILIVALATLFLTGELAVKGIFGTLNSFRYGLFQAVSILTTTGYATADFGTWPPSSQFILLPISTL